MKKWSKLQYSIVCSEIKNGLLGVTKNSTSERAPQSPSSVIGDDICVPKTKKTVNFELREDDEFSATER